MSRVVPGLLVVVLALVSLPVPVGAEPIPCLGDGEDRCQGVSIARSLDWACVGTYTEDGPCAGVLVGPVGKGEYPACATLGQGSKTCPAPFVSVPSGAPVGSAASCWGMTPTSLTFECVSGGGCDLSPAQEAGYVDTSGPQHGEKFVLGYHGRSLDSSDALPRAPGMLLRITDSFVVHATPLVVGPDGVPSLFVTYWQDGQLATKAFVNAPAGTPLADADYLVVADGSDYSIFVDDERVWSFEVGPRTGGWSGPGVGITCSSQWASLEWSNWLSIEAA